MHLFLNLEHMWYHRSNYIRKRKGIWNKTVRVWTGCICLRVGTSGRLL